MLCQYMKDCVKNNCESSYLKYWNLNNFYGWKMSQKLHLGGFKLVEETSQFKKDFIKNITVDSGIGHFLGADLQYPEELLEVHNDLAFLSQRMNIGKV